MNFSGNNLDKTVSCALTNRSNRGTGWARFLHALNYHQGKFCNAVPLSPKQYSTRGALRLLSSHRRGLAQYVRRHGIHHKACNQPSIFTHFDHWGDYKLNNKPTVRNIALLVIFGLLGLTRFTENVRTVQIIGLLGCGACFGVALTIIISAYKAKQTKV